MTSFTYEISAVVAQKDGAVREVGFDLEASNLQVIKDVLKEWYGAKLKSYKIKNKQTRQEFTSPGAASKVICITDGDSSLTWLQELEQVTTDIPQLEEIIFR